MNNTASTNSLSKPLIVLLALLTLPAAYKAVSIISSKTQSVQAHAGIKHLAVIMDGNRRWAEQRHLEKTIGHQQGAETLKRLIQYCLERKIEMVSVYVWSLENFNRPPEEVESLFDLLIKQADAIGILVKQGVKVRFIGDRSVFPDKIRQTIAKIEEETKNGTRLQLNLLFCYGGRQEIVCAVNSIIKDVKEGKIKDIDENAFRNYLWTENIPDPDLIIRTGGDKRLSNFLTYQTSYSELYFTDRYWPELTTADFDAALNDYAKRKRKFGK